MSGQRNAIFGMMAEGIDIAAIATLIGCKFTDVLAVRAELEGIAVEEARKRASRVFDDVSPELVDKKAKMDKRKALRAKMRDHKKMSHQPPAADRSCHETDTAALPRHHGYEGQGD